MAMKKFLIFAPHYSETNGGAIALHKLCDIINRNNGTAFIHPMFDSFEINLLNFDEISNKVLNEKKLFDSTYVYVVNPKYQTPIRHILNDRSYGDDWIVVYPEITFGNPLGARNIVRWLLHNPGFHTGKIYYGRNEFHIRHNSIFKPFHFPDCKFSDQFLSVADLNFDIFNTNGASEQRTGSAFCIRKGKDKPVQHDLNNSILIDGKSHAEVADIFKRVETFYSYDTATTYSHFAVLCGCDSVVIPDQGVSETEWRPNIRDRYGIAYGHENIEKARLTAHLVKPMFMEIANSSENSVLNFISEVNDYFK